MKDVIIKAGFVSFIVLFLVSCNNISNKPVSEKLTTQELSKAIKTDTSFSQFYEVLRKSVDDMDDIKKAKYNDVTYRRLFKYYKFVSDTNYWNSLSSNWDKEWQHKYGIYLPKADSILNYWRKFLTDNSLDKYVKIELAQIDKDYYEYIGDIKAVNLGFRLTPLQGTIEQVRFTYGYQAKINGDSKYYDKHNCISTAPFSSPTIRFWEVEYSDKDKFSGKTVETFLRDYNFYIEVTNIRKDGVNLSVDELSVPEKVTECLDDEKNYPPLVEFDKEKIIKELINKDFIGKFDYRNKKGNELREKKGKLCFDFVNQLK